MRQAVQKDAGGLIRLRVPDCVDLETATYTVYDPADSLLSGPTAITDPYSSAVSAQSSSGDLTSLSVTSPPAELRGQRIRCVPATGGSLDLRVEGVTATAVLVRLPRYGATIASVMLPELAAAVGSATCANTGRGYRVRWSYEADGVSTTRDTRYDVVYSVVPGISWAECLDRDPTLRVYLSTAGDIDYESMIDLAREAVDLEMGRYGDRSDCIAEHDDLVPLLVRAAQVKAAEVGLAPPAYRANPQTWLEYCRRRFTDECKSVLQTAYRQTLAGVQTAERTTLRTLYIRRA